MYVRQKILDNIIHTSSKTAMAIIINTTPSRALPPSNS